MIDTINQGLLHRSESLCPRARAVGWASAALKLTHYPPELPRSFTLCPVHGVPTFPRWIAVMTTAAAVATGGCGGYLGDSATEAPGEPVPTSDWVATFESDGASAIDKEREYAHFVADLNKVAAF